MNYFIYLLHLLPIEAAVRNLLNSFSLFMDFSETKLLNKCQSLKHAGSKWTLIINEMKKYSFGYYSV